MTAAFIDGNKRTAFVAAERYLALRFDAPHEVALPARGGAR